MAPNEPTLVEGGLNPAQRKANQRARDKGLPEPFVRVNPEELAARKSQHDLDLAFATEFDATGKFYKSECRPLVDLLAVYYGADIHDKESDDDEEASDSKKKKPKKKTNQPNPSQQVIRIKAAWGPNGEPIEPACWVGCDHTSCGKHLRQTFEVDGIVSFKKWLDLRDRARKDLFWLCRLLNKTPFHSVHQYVCDQFVQKNFDGLWFPGFGIEDHKHAFREQKKNYFANQGTNSNGDPITNDGVVTTNELMLLEQRGGYKSTIDGIDCVQWLLNAPNCRVMVITAFRHLAKKRAKEIKEYFFLAKKGVPSTFHILFPEYITRGVAGRSDGPLECPARTGNFFKEDSMWFTSMESSATGDHCCILKGDDIVDPDNSADEEMREALKYDFDSRKTDLLDDWGFVIVTGTRYFTDDMYGERFKPNPESKRVNPFRYSCRGALTLSPEDFILYSLPNGNPHKLTLAQVLKEERGTLVFPAKNSWAKLRSIYDDKSERNFKNQQMNEATDKSDITDFINHFTSEFLRSRLRPKDYVPIHAEYFQLWDTAYSETSTSDFTVGVYMAKWTLKDGRVACAVVDAVFGKWRAKELATHIALFLKKHPETRGIYIEKAPGFDWLNDTIMSAGFTFGVPHIKALIRPFEIDNTKNAKRNRIKNLEILMMDDRLSFISDATWNDACFRQFEIFTGEPSNKTRKDDFPDAISFAFKCILPRDVISGVDEDTNETKMKREEERKQYLLKAHYERMHGGFIGGTRTNPGPPTPQGPTASTFGRRNEPPPVLAPPRQLTPREQAIEQMMKILPPGLRRRGQ